MSKETKAEKAYRKLLYGKQNRTGVTVQDWRPTSREFYDWLGVEESAGGRIKRQVKELAADDGHVFGYHPGLNCLMVVPRGNRADAQAIIDFAARSASRAIGGLQDQIRGAAGERFVTYRSANEVIGDVASAGETIEAAVNKLRWKKASNV